METKNPPIQYAESRHTKIEGKKQSTNKRMGVGKGGNCKEMLRLKITEMGKVSTSIAQEFSQPLSLSPSATCIHEQPHPSRQATRSGQLLVTELCQEPTQVANPPNGSTEPTIHGDGDGERQGAIYNLHGHAYVSYRLASLTYFQNHISFL